MAIMKHVGKYGEKPCLVLFREVPSEPENCLVVMTGALEDSDHDDLMNVINSPEAQEAKEISGVLQRRDFRTGGNMLQGLHTGGKIQKVPVSLVSLTPTPAQSVPLADVNAELRKLENNPIPPVTDSAHLNNDTVNPGTGEQEHDPVAVAQNLRTQADIMEADVKAMNEDIAAKRAEADRLESEANLDK